MVLPIAQGGRVQRAVGVGKIAGIGDKFVKKGRAGMVQVPQRFARHPTVGIGRGKVKLAIEDKVGKLEVTWAKAIGLVLGGGGIGGVVAQLLQKIW